MKKITYETDTIFISIYQSLCTIANQVLWRDAKLPHYINSQGGFTMKHLTLLFLFLFIPTLLIVGCSETENSITGTGQPQIDPTQIDPTKIVVIPDENLAKSIREALELSEDVDITAGQLATLESLYCSGGRITDWTGMEYATQLHSLNLSRCLLSTNPITGERESIWDWDKEAADLTPLAGLKNLAYLYLDENLIKDLTPLKVLRNLELLDLRSYHYIEDLSPLTELKQLTYLNLSPWGIPGKIKDITPLAELKQLTWLDISAHRINDITPLAGLKQLTELNLSYNEISDVTPLTGLINLEKLWLEGNPIVDKTPLEELRKKNPNVKIDILD